MFIKECKCCGRKCTNENSEFIGVQEGLGQALELWNCSCGSTLAIVVNELIRRIRRAG